MPQLISLEEPTGFTRAKSSNHFGHGLKYSSFSKIIISAPSTVLIKQNANNIYSSNDQAIDVTIVKCKDLQFDIVISVKNSRPRGGSHVVLMFSKPPSASVAGAPNVQLVGFERVDVKRGKIKTVTVRFDVCKGLISLWILMEKEAGHRAAYSYCCIS